MSRVPADPGGRLPGWRTALVAVALLVPLAARGETPPPGLGTRFTDVTAAAGIPPTRYVEGVSLHDVDGDGLPDLVVPDQRGPNRLFLNRGGTFREAPGPPDLGEGGIGALVHDFDGDGRSDLFFTRGNNQHRTNLLYRGRPDGGFAEAGAALGLAGRGNSVCAALLDADGDGNTDLLVTGWGSDLLHLGGAPGAPYRDGSPLLGPPDGGRHWGIMAADFDGDGRTDLLVGGGARGRPGSPRLLLNGPGGFRDATSSAGLADLPWSMGGAAADLDQDGDTDLFLTFMEARDRLYLNDGRGRFSEATPGSGITSARSMGAAVGLLDDDPLPDLVVAGFGAPTRAYRNLGGGRFLDVTAPWGIGGAGRDNSAVLADTDGDGDLDLYLTNFDGGNRLYRNDTPPGPRPARRLPASFGFCSQGDGPDLRPPGSH
jgi:hypothetical protein